MTAPGRTRVRGLPEYGFYTDMYQTECDGHVGGHVGSAAPPGFGEGGQCWPGQAWSQTIATCNWTEAALPLTMVSTLTRSLFGSISASDTFLEHFGFIQTNPSPQVVQTKECRSQTPNAL